MRRIDADEQGMILINVLLFVAIASGLVLLMVSRQDIALDRALRTRDAARALAIARGGETSAVVALRRDLATAPDADYPGEGWGSVAENGAPIAGGSFDLAIADAQGRFNINNVRSGETSDLIEFMKIGKAAGLNEQQIGAAIGLVQQYGPITDLRPIELAGVDPKVAARLAHLVTALPGTTDINLNAADPAVLSAFFSDPATVQQLVDIRQRAGHLTKKDLSTLGVTMPTGTGFTSDHFWVRVRASIGDTRQEEAALIERGKDKQGDPQAATIERWRNTAIPPDVPSFAPAGNRTGSR